MSWLWFPASLLLHQLIRWWGRSVYFSDRKVLFWPSGTTGSHFAASEEVGMGSDKTGRGICVSGNEIWCSSLQSRGINVRLRMIVWVKVAKLSSNWPIQVLKMYSNFYQLSRVKELSQLESCQWKYSDRCHSRCVLSLVPVCLRSNAAPISSCIRLRQA